MGVFAGSGAKRTISEEIKVKCILACKNMVALS